jgi:hypothetical protein
VSAPDSYARTARYAERGGVVTDRAVDPITGLPVLVYRFPGESVPGADAIAADEVWHVLDRGVDERGGYLVSTVVEAAVPIEAQPASLDDHAAARAFAAVAAAADAGVVHGDLGAHRIHRRGAQTWIEGYGVPWSADATLAEDARALARGLLALPGHGLSAAAVRVLRSAVRDGDAGAAADALRDVASDDREDEPEASPAAPAPGRAAGSPFGEVMLPVLPRSSSARARTARDDAIEAFNEVRIGGGPEGGASGPGDSPGGGDPASEAPPDPRPATRPMASGPVVRTPAATSPKPSWTETLGSTRAAGARPRTTGGTAGGGPRFSKTPPPEVTYRPGDEARRSADPPVRASAVATSAPDRRRLWLLGLLVVASIALALMLVWGGRDAGGPETVGAGGSYPVVVRVTPERLPPVSLVVVSSPPGSQYAAGTVIRSVPDRIVLDREGTWQLQGRFEGRHSSVVTVVVPTDVPVVLPFADVP